MMMIEDLHDSQITFGSEERNSVAYEYLRLSEDFDFDPECSR